MVITCFILVLVSPLSWIHTIMGFCQSRLQDTKMRHFITTLRCGDPLFPTVQACLRTEQKYFKAANQNLYPNISQKLLPVGQAIGRSKVIHPCTSQLVESSIPPMDLVIVFGAHTILFEKPIAWALASGYQYVYMKNRLQGYECAFTHAKPTSSKLGTWTWD